MNLIHHPKRFNHHPPNKRLINPPNKRFIHPPKRHIVSLSLNCVPACSGTCSEFDSQKVGVSKWRNDEMAIYFSFSEGKKKCMSQMS